MRNLNKEIPELPPLTIPPNENCKVKRFFFCRHAETDPNASFQLQGSGIDETLNSKGIAQAEALAERMSKIPDIGFIITSHLKRAIQTSEIIANAYPKKLEIIKEKQLAEISWGVWEGMVCPDLKSLIETWMSGDFTARAPGGETPIEVRERVLPIIYSLLSRPEQNILVVVHGRLLRIVLSSILYGNLYHMQSFNHRNTCVNVVDIVYEPQPFGIFNSTTSLKNLTSIRKGNVMPMANRSSSPIIRNLSGGGILITPIPVNTNNATTNSNNSSPTHVTIAAPSSTNITKNFSHVRNSSTSSCRSNHSFSSHGSGRLATSLDGHTTTIPTTVGQININMNINNISNEIPPLYGDDNYDEHSHEKVCHEEKSSGGIKHVSIQNISKRDDEDEDEDAINSCENSIRIRSSSIGTNDSNNNNVINGGSYVTKLENNYDIDFETPIFDVSVSTGEKYKVKFMPLLLDSIEHLTSDLY